MYLANVEFSVAGFVLSNSFCCFVRQKLLMEIRAVAALLGIDRKVT